MSTTAVFWRMPRKMSNNTDNDDNPRGVRADDRARSHRFVALVPAAGRGERVGAGMPKQYLPLAGRPMIAWTLSALLREAWIETVHVVTAPSDTTFHTNQHLLALSHRHAGRLQWHPVGGQSRQETVSNGLDMLRSSTGLWVMVHDAARPGIPAESLQALRGVIESGARGALLATRVADTVKREVSDDAPLVRETVDRAGLWLAQTPQVFRADQLQRGLQAAHRDGIAVTDEASAMEHVKLPVTLVPGHWRNLKVTTTDDVALMQTILAGEHDEQD